VNLADLRSRFLPEGFETAGQDRHGRAIVFMLLSAASFAVMGAAVKLAGDLPVHEKVLARGLVMLIVTTGLAVRRRENPFGPTRRLGVLILRGLLGTTGVVLYFTAVQHLYLADAALLNKMSPFFVSVFAAVWLGERLTRRVATGLALAFLGATLVLKPAFEYESAWPALAGVGSGLFAGAAYTTVRAVKGIVAPGRVVFYFALISSLAMLPWLLVEAVAPVGWQWLWLAATGACAVVGQLFLTQAYHHAQAARISIFAYTHVLFSLMLGLLLWGERPDVLSYLGGGLIVGAAIWNRHAR